LAADRVSRWLATPGYDRIYPVTSEQCLLYTQLAKKRASGACLGKLKRDLQIRCSNRSLAVAALSTIVASFAFRAATARKRFPGIWQVPLKLPHKRLSDLSSLSVLGLELSWLFSASPGLCGV
jgi:hypothetical protein